MLEEQQLLHFLRSEPEMTVVILKEKEIEEKKKLNEENKDKKWNFYEY